MPGVPQDSCPTSMVATTSFVAGSMRNSDELRWLAAQTDPNPTAIRSGDSRGIEARTPGGIWLVRGDGSADGVVGTGANDGVLGTDGGDAFAPLAVELHAVARAAP